MAACPRASAVSVSPQRNARVASGSPRHDTRAMGRARSAATRRRAGRGRRTRADGRRRRRHQRVWQWMVPEDSVVRGDVPYLRDSRPDRSPAYATNGRACRRGADYRGAEVRACLFSYRRSRNSSRARVLGDLRRTDRESRAGDSKRPVRSPLSRALTAPPGVIVLRKNGRIETQHPLPELTFEDAAARGTYRIEVYLSSAPGQPPVPVDRQQPDLRAASWMGSRTPRAASRGDRCMGHSRRTVARRK